MVPASAPDFATLWRNIDAPPDLKIVALATAAAEAKGCRPDVNVTQVLLDAGMQWVAAAEQSALALQGGVGAQWQAAPLLQHDRRAVAFILAASPRREVQDWLAGEVGLHGGWGGLGLRTVDRITLLDTIARSSGAGYDAVAKRVQQAVARYQDRTPADGEAGASGVPMMRSREAQDAAAQLQVLQAAVRLATSPRGSDKLPKWVSGSGVLSDVHTEQQQQRLHTEHRAAAVIC